METGEIRRLRVAGRFAIVGAPKSKEERRREYAGKTLSMVSDRAAANAVFEILSRHPLDRWVAILSEQRDAWTPQMVQRLVAAAGEIEEDAPAEALAILDVAAYLVAQTPPSSFAYATSRLHLACGRAAALVDLGRGDEALAEIRNARGFVTPDCGAPLDRAQVLVERAYVDLRMGRRRYVLRMLHAALRVMEEFGGDPARALRVYVLATSEPIELSAEGASDVA